MGEKTFAVSLDTVLTNLADNPLPGLTTDRSAGIGRRAAPMEATGRTRWLAISMSGDVCCGPRSPASNGWRATLDGAFGRALDLCAAARGRLIVTGIGKSGHVARKIAATLASTGKPAQFVHAAEASHGDLGMIGAEDAILALSNSGESGELADIIAYSRRFEIPLIAITAGRELDAGAGRRCRAAAAGRGRGVPDGAGADDLDDDDDGARRRAGDRAAGAQGVFVRPISSCSIPAAGSAGGLLRVADIMHSGDAVPLVSPQTPMSEAILVMTAKSFGCVGVCDGEGRLVGVITDGDLRRHMDDRLLARTSRGDHARRAEDDHARASRRRGAGADEPLRDHRPVRRR